MLEHGLEPDFPEEAVRELSSMPATGAQGVGRDLRPLPWASIDNDDSRDLDQLTVAEALKNRQTRILVAIADVDALVHKGSAIDRHAAHNTTSVYTPAAIFPMLPEALSTGLTSLNQDEDRAAIVADMIFEEDGTLAASELYQAQVRNHAKLAYRSVAAWLDGKGPMPERIAKVPGLDENLRLQDTIAQRLMEKRHREGALSLESIEPRAVFEEDNVTRLDLDPRNRARQIIEDFMIAANGVAARYLEAKGLPSLRRVLRSPERWDRIVRLAAEYRVTLPPEPDGEALEKFLELRQKADPVTFPDLSLCVIKLIGKGEYSLELPGRRAPGHFGLAVTHYTHATAPNRRFTDLITQRLLKASFSGRDLPYSISELTALAELCTQREDDATKIERQLRKSAAALLLSRRIGEQFDAIVTGASPKGTWVRIAQPPIEGRLEAGFEGLDVGHRVRVQLVQTNVERGFIDFVRAR